MRASHVPPASFDSVALAAALAECRTLTGTRLVHADQIDAHSIALVLRGAPGTGPSRTLLLSIHPQWGRMHLTGRTKSVQATPFLRQISSRLDGAVLRSIDAPLFERVVTLGFDGLEGACELTAEIMGRRSNLILRAGGVILGAHKMVGGVRGREILPQRPYVPPALSRPDPTNIAADDLAGIAARGPNDRPAWRTVLEATSGIGPALAHEVCLRAGADPYRPLPGDGAGAVADALHALGDAVRAGQFTPMLYRDAEGTPAAYAAFPMRIYEGLAGEPASMSAAVEEVTERAAEVGRLEAARQALNATVRGAARRVKRAQDAVADDMRAAEDAGRLREQGELILAYLNQVAPGAQTVDVPGFDGTPVSIPLDPSRSAVENAQAYFRRYARATAARRRLPRRQSELEAERAFLENVATAIAQADDADDLWEVEQDLIAAGLRRRAEQSLRPRAASAGRTFDLAGGYRVRVGRSARENDHLTFEDSRPNDLWLHARGMPGAHVILSAEAGKATEAAIETAARIAAHYSTGRGATKVPVDVTPRRFVRRVHGGRPGQVVYTNERTINVAPGLPAHGQARAVKRG
ncbi:MAG: Rqc2 family fibronectin-binding protein [Armatimonadota bacterium]